MMQKGSTALDEAEGLTWTSSKSAQVPRTLVSRLLTVLCTTPPVAAATLFKSSSATCHHTLPFNMPLF